MINSEQTNLSENLFENFIDIKDLIDFTDCEITFENNDNLNKQSCFQQILYEGSNKLPDMNHLNNNTPALCAVGNFENNNDEINPLISPSIEEILASDIFTPIYSAINYDSFTYNIDNKSENENVEFFNIFMDNKNEIEDKELQTHNEVNTDSLNTIVFDIGTEENNYFNCYNVELNLENIDSYNDGEINKKINLKEKKIESFSRKTITLSENKKYETPINEATFTNSKKRNYQKIIDLPIKNHENLIPKFSKITRKFDYKVNDDETNCIDAKIYEHKNCENINKFDQSKFGSTQDSNFNIPNDLNNYDVQRKNDPSYFEKRQKNNDSVRRSRDKAKQKNIETEQKVKILTDENIKLQKKVDNLERELLIYKNIFKSISK